MSRKFTKFVAMAIVLILVMSSFAAAASYLIF